MQSAMNFYSEISEGGISEYVKNHHGIKSYLSDGTETLFRPYPATDDSPAVEIKINLENRPHKIHFIKR